MSKLNIFEILIKLEDYSNFDQNRRYLKRWSKLKIFEILIKLEDYSNFGQNQRYSRSLFSADLLSAAFFKIQGPTVFKNFVKIEDFSKVQESY